MVHKFISTGGSTYSRVVFCEYCGLVVFDGNKEGSANHNKETAGKPCPCSPEKLRNQIKEELFKTMVPGTIERTQDDTESLIFAHITPMYKNQPGKK